MGTTTVSRGSMTGVAVGVFELVGEGPGVIVLVAEEVKVGVGEGPSV